MNRKKPWYRSLKNLFIIWFVIGSVIPVCVITFYSAKKSREAVTLEQNQRFVSSRTQIEAIFLDFEKNLMKKINEHSKSKELQKSLGEGNFNRVNQIAQTFFAGSVVRKIRVFNQEGQLKISLFKNPKGLPQRNTDQESEGFFISEKILKRFNKKNTLTHIEIRGGNLLELIAFSKIKKVNGSAAGYIEEIIDVQTGFLNRLKKRMQVEIALFLGPGSGTDSKKFFSNRSLATKKSLKNFSELFYKKRKSLELRISKEPHLFSTYKLNWGGQTIYMALGASRKHLEKSVDKVNYIFYSLFFVVIVFLLVMYFIFSKVAVTPISNLTKVIREHAGGKGFQEVPNVSGTEIGELIDSFNEMSRQIKEKIQELEQANKELKEAQTKLIHTTRMAGLGQLVAGIAHELNNPIGFIYSNMGHLKTYSESLLKVVSAASKGSEELGKVKEEVDFNYIVKDIPRLIKSCEEGARRTKDIVVGLRSFSRIEVSKLVEADVIEGLEKTLDLLQGEIKNRVEIAKNFSDIPKIRCYQSELNQVFMNILSNAIQAVELQEKGRVSLSVGKKDSNHISIAIKDNGEGMDKETLDKIFDPFFTSKQQGQGTGLGLSISYGIIQKHEGEIRVFSEKGKGAEFIITLPIDGPSKNNKTAKN